MKKHLILLASGLLLVSGVAYTADTQTFAANLTATESTASNDTSPELFANSYSVSGDTITVSAKNGSEIGTVLNHRMQETFELEKLYGEVKNKYDVLYKDLNIEKNKTATILIAVILVASLLFNILNFISLMRQWNKLRQLGTGL